jgi:SAM-dependent methyltransferase
MTLYSLKVRLLKTHRGNAAWRRWRMFRGDEIGDYGRMPDLVREYAPGGSFVDVGCMWGVNGEYSFVAEEAGATSVTGVDVFGPTPEFEEKRRIRNSSVRFVLGDATRRETIEAVGGADVVLCAGVLYHHPSPFDVLTALRRFCRETLILRTATIPEMLGVRNAAVYYPLLLQGQRKLWDLSSLGLGGQVGITGPFEKEAGYGNWFWGLTPSCLIALVRTAGFEVERHAREAFATTLVCRAVQPAFEHALPDEVEAREMGESISREGLARPQ